MSAQLCLFSVIKPLASLWSRTPPLPSHQSPHPLIHPVPSPSSAFYPQSVKKSVKTGHRNFDVQDQVMLNFHKHTNNGLKFRNSGSSNPYFSWPHLQQCRILKLRTQPCLISITMSLGVSIFETQDPAMLNFHHHISSSPDFWNSRPSHA